jgi:hypothetical protein
LCCIVDQRLVCGRLVVRPDPCIDVFDGDEVEDGMEEDRSEIKRGKKDIIYSVSWHDGVTTTGKALGHVDGIASGLSGMADSTPFLHDARWRDKGMNLYPDQ